LQFGLAIADAVELGAIAVGCGAGCARSAPLFAPGVLATLRFDGFDSVEVSAEGEVVALAEGIEDTS
jgi:hypothetical protein